MSVHVTVVGWESTGMVWLCRGGVDWSCIVRSSFGTKVTMSFFMEFAMGIMSNRDTVGIKMGSWSLLTHLSVVLFLTLVVIVVGASINISWIIAVLRVSSAVVESAKISLMLRTVVF